jgi:serine/threonine protein kinase
MVPVCCRGDVFSEIGRMGGAVTEADAVRLVLYPFLLGMNYLHGNRIVHRDIKPEVGRWIHVQQ